ncbi:hypothetical protein JTB14_006564 [Gonioctena quinquepunctata]|nr:hypothetical protein JTB14_006564 [Gonioctena quinquepunctata]
MSKIFCVLHLYAVNRVTADYCEFGTCNEDQYCCGENKCCEKTVEVWYFWAGILLIAIVIFFIICFIIRSQEFWKYHSYRKLIEENATPIS